MSSRHTDDPQQLPAGWGIPMGVVGGAAIGTLVGILLEQLALGLIGGAAIGLVVGASATAVAATPAHRRGSVLALAVALVAAGLATVVLLVLR